MQRRPISLVGAVFLSVVAAACSKPASGPVGELGTETKPKPSAAPAAPTTGYTTAEVSGGGTIKGTVTFAGTKPTLPLVRCAKDPDVCGKPRPNQTLLVGPNDALKNVIVSLTDIHAGKAPTPGQAHIDIKQCAYVPRVQAVVVKSNLMVTSQDLIPHDFNGAIRSRGLFNRTVVGKSEIVDLYTPGMLTVGCDVHGGSGNSQTCETGVVGVMPNPYFAVTGEDGQFMIPDVPPGNYTLQVWHETLGQQEQRVNLESGASVVANFKLASKPN